MVEGAVEPTSEEATVARAREAQTPYAAAALIAPVQLLDARDEEDPLPVDPGVYLFKDPNCLGQCAWVRGFSSRLGAFFSWTPRSVYAVGAGALWRTELLSRTSAPAPDRVFPANQLTRINILTFAPKAAEKR
jgi:hypothetical protein